MDDVYLLNSPFTFQSMEKHSAYCAMMRLGLKVPRDRAGPVQEPASTTPGGPTPGEVQPAVRPRRDRRRDRLPAVHEAVRRRRLARRLADRGRDDLYRAYDESGEMLMHLQAVDGHDVFARALSIGPETMVMRFLPDEPMHDRYAVTTTSSRPARRRGGHHQPHRQRVLPLGVQLLRDAREGRRGLPDRLRQRLPRRRGHLAALLLPLGDEGLVRWSGLLPGHGPGRPLDTATRRYFEIADREDLSYDEKLAAYRRLADELLRDRALPRVVRRRMGDLDEMRPGLGRRPGLRRAARRDRQRDLPAARAGAASSPTSAACWACGVRDEGARIGSAPVSPAT